MTWTVEPELPTCVLRDCKRVVEYQDNGSLSRYCGVTHKRVKQTASAVAVRSVAPVGRDLNTDAKRIAYLWDLSVDPSRDGWLDPRDFTALMELFTTYVRGNT